MSDLSPLLQALGSSIPLDSSQVSALLAAVAGQSMSIKWMLVEYSVEQVALDTDSDDDGFGDAVEGNVDTDGDGTADFRDSDSDNDTVPDADEFDGDTDEDGTPNRLDDDDDGDGYSTETENGWSSTDIDEDGTPNYIDTDADGDGTLDADEGEGDVDCDNIENVQDSNDLDGVCDDGSGGGDDGCGCTAAPAPGMMAMWMGLFGLLITVRRRRA